MALSDVLLALGTLPVAGGWATWIASYRRDDLHLRWLSNGLFAAGSWVWLISAVVEQNRAAVAIQGFAALWNTWLWWRNRHNRRRRKAGLALGEKSRAVIEGMVAKLKPSPIPSPAGA